MCRSTATDLAPRKFPMHRHGRKKAGEGGREWRERETETEREKSRSGMFFKFMSAPPQRQRSLALLGGGRREEEEEEEKSY